MLDDTSARIHVPAIAAASVTMPGRPAVSDLDVRQNLDYGRRMNRRAIIPRTQRVIELLDIGCLLRRRPGRCPAASASGERLDGRCCQRVCCCWISRLDRWRGPQVEILPYLIRCATRPDSHGYVSHDVAELRRLARRSVMLRRAASPPSASSQVLPGGRHLYRVWGGIRTRSRDQSLCFPSKERSWLVSSVFQNRRTLAFATAQTKKFSGERQSSP